MNNILIYVCIGFTIILTIISCVMTYLKIMNNNNIENYRTNKLDVLNNKISDTMIELSKNLNNVEGEWLDYNQASIEEKESNKIKTINQKINSINSLLENLGPNVSKNESYNQEIKYLTNLADNILANLGNKEFENYLNEIVNDLEIIYELVQKHNYSKGQINSGVEHINFNLPGLKSDVENINTTINKIGSDKKKFDNFNKTVANNTKETNEYVLNLTHNIKSHEEITNSLNQKINVINNHVNSIKDKYPATFIQGKKNGDQIQQYIYYNTNIDNSKFAPISRFNDNIIDAATDNPSNILTNDNVVADLFTTCTNIDPSDRVCEFMPTSNYNSGIPIKIITNWSG